jgi:hypothetical protein
MPPLPGLCPRLDKTIPCGQYPTNMQMHDQQPIMHLLVALDRHREYADDSFCYPASRRAAPDLARRRQKRWVKVDKGKDWLPNTRLGLGSSWRTTSDTPPTTETCVGR